MSDVKFTKNVGNKQGRLSCKQRKLARFIRNAKKNVGKTSRWSSSFMHFQIIHGLWLIGSKRSGVEKRALTPRRALSPLAFSRTPKTARHAARTAASTSPGSSGDSDGDSDGSDSSDLPSQLPSKRGGFRNNNNPRKENNSKKQRKQTIVELSNRLELGSAALMFAAVVSLVMGWSK